MNLPVRMKASRKKAKEFFFYVLLGVLPTEGMSQTEVGLPTSDQECLAAWLLVDYRWSPVDNHD